MPLFLHFYLEGSRLKNSISVQNLCFSYNKKDLTLEDISFTLHQNDILFILGPNGSGKSTLLKCMAGILKLKSGKVEILGRSLVDYSRKELAKIMSYVPQVTQIVFDLPVIEYVVMGTNPWLGLFSSPKKNEYLLGEKVLYELGISYLLNKKITEISGGEKKLVMIARALCQKPKIVLFDEPFANLDPRHQLTLIKVLKQLLCDTEITVCLTIHDPNLLCYLEGQSLFLKNGRVFKNGPSKELLLPDLLSCLYETSIKFARETGRDLVVPWW